MTVQASPSRGGDRLGADTTGWSRLATLQPVPPFDFAHSLAFLDMFPPTSREQTTSGDLTKAFLVDRQPVAIRVTSSGTIAAPNLSLEVRMDTPITTELQASIVDRIGFYLSLDDDLRAFYELGQNDHAFAPVIELLYGYHQVKFPTPFECASWAILSQRTPMAVARRAKQALAAAFGRSIVIDGTEHWPFPEPATLAATTVAEIANVAHHERKAAHLHATTTAFAEADEAFLRHGPLDEVRAWLLGINGIGPWSASFILIRGLGRMNQSPIEAELERAAGLRYGPLSPALLAATAQRYGPWQGYWAHYLRVAADRPSPSG